MSRFSLHKSAHGNVHVSLDNPLTSEAIGRIWPGVRSMEESINSWTAKREKKTILLIYSVYFLELIVPSALIYNLTVHDITGVKSADEGTSRGCSRSTCVYQGYIKRWLQRVSYMGKREHDELAMCCCVFFCHRFLTTSESIHWDHGWTLSKDPLATSLQSVANANDPW